MVYIYSLCFMSITLFPCFCSSQPFVIIISIVIIITNRSKQAALTLRGPHRVQLLHVNSFMVVCNLSQVPHNVFHSQTHQWHQTNHQEQGGL